MKHKVEGFIVDCSGRDFNQNILLVLNIITDKVKVCLISENLLEIPESKFMRYFVVYFSCLLLF